MKLNKESTYSRIFHYLALFLFAGLFVVGFVVTGYNGWVWSEFPDLTENNPLLTVVMLILAWFALKGLSYVYDRFLKNVDPAVIMAAACVLVYAISVIWVISAQAVPQADQLALYLNAKEINNGTIAPMDKGSYLVFFSYQLGFVTFLRILIKIFGEDNYTGVQLVLALSSPIIVFAGSVIIKHILGDKAGKARFLYAILMVLCLPMHIYTTFIYGDLPFAAMSLVCILLMYECLSKPKVWKFVLFFLSCGINYLFKVNALIVFAAMGIFLLFSFIYDREKRKSAVLLLILMVAGSVSFYMGNRGLYGDLIPEGYDSPPMLATVVMGMNDDNGNAGWCNFYHQNTFVAAGYDADAAEKVCVADLGNTLKYWVTHPLYTVDFLYRKINLQWNTPFYQALCMNSTHDAENQPALGKLIYDNENVHMGLQKFMKAYQLAAYGFIALALFISRKRERKLKVYVPMIAVFGAFLFSLMWESKTRYQMPAFIMLIPCFAAVIPYVLEWAEGLKTTGIREICSFDEPAPRKNYNGIDLFKVIMAVFVVAIHTLPHIALAEGAGYKLVDRLINTAVPFFFLSAGFLLSRKMMTIEASSDKEKAIVGYIFKMIRMYVLWSLIYLPFAVYDAVKKQYPWGYAIKKYVQEFFFIGDHFNSYILWYLLGSVYAMLFVWLVYRLNLKDITIFLWATVIFAMSMYLTNIQYLDDAKGLVSVVQVIMGHTTGNGRVFTGLFYVPVGMLLSRRQFKIRTGALMAACGYVLSITGIFGGWAIALASVGFFILAKEISLPDSKIWLVLRHLSTGYYYIHLYVWFALYMIIYKKTWYGPAIFAYTIVVSTVLSGLFFFVMGKVRKVNGAKGE